MVLPNLTRQIVAPVGLAVVGIAAVAWYVAFLTTDSLMSFTMMPAPLVGPTEFALFFTLMTTMMIAMMLPATLPMILGYRQMLKTKGAVSAGAPANFGTTAFMAPYILVWGGIGVVALFGLTILGLIGPVVGPAAFVPGVILIAAGVYQVTSVKQACLRQCQSPLKFMLGRWRKGLGGAFHMGLYHSLFCVGCCWLFMITLFVTGAMSLLWMGAVSVMIFVEKVGVKKNYVSRGIGLLLVVLGVAVSTQAFLTI